MGRGKTGNFWKAAAILLGCALLTGCGNTGEVDDYATNIGYLSLGNRDLIGICMRLALVEAMYEEQKPFLILDDPFVNLDENRTKGAMRFLTEIAKEYQVIYFTCHGSRE